MRKTFKKFIEFVNESLVILTLKGLMKNEFMNNNQLRQDYETARRIMYENTSSIFAHTDGEEFTARTLKDLTPEQIDQAISTVNEQTKRIKFTRKGPAKKTIVKEFVWRIIGEI
jgi:hypothetical protein